MGDYPTLRLYNNVTEMSQTGEMVVSDREICLYTVSFLIESCSFLDLVLAAILTPELEEMQEHRHEEILRKSCIKPDNTPMKLYLNIFSLVPRDKQLKLLSLARE